jgi:hypothetical protein
MRLLVINGAETPEPPGYAFGEGLAVIHALLNTRTAHGRRIEALARARRDPPLSAATLRMGYLTLDTGAYTLPLGWHLSARSRAAIEAAAGGPSDEACRALDGVSPEALAISACTMARVRADLRHAARDEVDSSPSPGRSAALEWPDQR